MFSSAIVFGQAPSFVTLSSSPNPARYGQAVTLRAFVASDSSGKVTFYDGTTVLGIGTISGGQATFTTTLLESGMRSLRAYYKGDVRYSPGHSAAIPQRVVAGVSMGFHLDFVNYPVDLATKSVSAVGMAVADVNGDGISDISVVGEQGLAILLGKGDGTFQRGFTYPTSIHPLRVAAGDFNGDGNIDLAVGGTTGTVGILLGNGDGTFRPTREYYAVGGGSGNSVVAAVIVGDFNGDGDLDVAAAANSSVNVLLGNGDGTLRDAVLYSVPTGSGPMAAADFNGDGNADVVVAGEGGISVLLGNGDGTLQAALGYPMHAFPYSVVAGDLNSDGKADVAVPDFWGSSVSVLLGNGDGTLQPAAKYPVMLYPKVLVAGDFNGDGILDLAVDPKLQVLLGKGDGTFHSGWSYSRNIESYGFAVGDFNGDGVADLVETAFFGLGNGYGNYGVSVRLGGARPDLTIAETHGGLTQGQTGATYTTTVTNIGEAGTGGEVKVVQSLAPAFTTTGISGDGWTCVMGTLACTRSDSLAIGSAYPPIRTTVNVSAGFAGNATNTATVSGGGDQNYGNNLAGDTAVVRFMTSTSVSASPNPAMLGRAVTITATVTSGATGKVAFYDGSTVLGVAALSAVRASDAANLLPVGRRPPLRQPSAHASFLLPSGIRSLHAEYIGDGRYGPSRSTALTQTVTAVPANGLQPPSTYPVSGSPSAIAVADFNRDGKPDIVTANGNGSISVLLGNGDGTFRAAVIYPGHGVANGVVVGDFDGDGKTDVAVCGSQGISDISIFFGNGDGTFRPAVQYGARFYNSPAAADFNGDGKTDLVVFSQVGPSVNVFLGNGDGTMQPPVTTTFSGFDYGGLVVADFNEDGKPDLVCFGNQYNYTGPVLVLLGNGDGTFQPPVPYSDAKAVNPFSYVVGDFNGDGRLDVAGIHSQGITVFLGNGDGTLGTRLTSRPSQPDRCSAMAGDFNGDGKLDILCAAGASAQLYVAFGNGDGTFQPGGMLPISTSASAIAIADFNGDGRPDFAAASYDSVRVYLGGKSSGFPSATRANSRRGKAGLTRSSSRTWRLRALREP